MNLKALPSAVALIEATLNCGPSLPRTHLLAILKLAKPTLATKPWEPFFRGGVQFRDPNQTPPGSEVKNPEATWLPHCFFFFFFLFFSLFFSVVVPGESSGLRVFRGWASEFHPQVSDFFRRSEHGPGKSPLANNSGPKSSKAEWIHESCSKPRVAGFYFFYILLLRLLIKL